MSESTHEHWWIMYEGDGPVVAQLQKMNDGKTYVWLFGLDYPLPLSKVELIKQLEPPPPPS